MVRRDVRSSLFVSVGVLTCCVVLVIALACLKISNTFSAIPPGIWRATLDLSGSASDIADERTRGLLPFNFEVRYITADSFVIDLINGDERITCTDITMAFDRSIAKDTIRIVLPVFGSYITARYEEDALSGDWWDPGRGPEYHIPFYALNGRQERFEVPVEAPYADFNGRWNVLFSVETDTPERAIGVFKQNTHTVTGTFLTETGDYRYLDGNVVDNRIFLSTFDGSHAYLFEAKMLDNGTLSGTYRSGGHYKTYWTAERNDSVTLADPFAMTPLADSSAQISFAFTNVDGEMVSLNDSQYAGKPKIVTIFGTWCPNCRDESAFLTDYLKHHPDPGFEIVSLAFERLDSAKAMQAIRNYKEHFEIPWEILYCGSSKKSEVIRKLPFFSTFVSFPTMVFLNEDNRVVKIHTGFNGPATEAYEGFKAAFSQTVNTLTAQ